jgi:hypothetical protein
MGTKGAINSGIRSEVEARKDERVNVRNWVIIRRPFGDPIREANVNYKTTCLIQENSSFKF